ncbi:MAG TPA: RNB domain-containing ribonuclease [Methanospirillum sp.]|uniref:RNB domain-containing ribonuclease n=1 Tax=Methanospirillum sp. TaxID=45200 RepID=UPI002C8B83DE|nr:RNB domain-containing ribonuclease [Methanospirillum sp.]HWQ64959.1 RNB domain-containing ribonuclease [Methanospirillum sp.]
MQNNNQVDLKTIAYDAMVKYGFEPVFPKSALVEVQQVTEKLIEPWPTKTRDLRTLLWSSIDNVDSMDLDQIEYCEKGKTDEIHVKIAIADVDFFVLKNSHIDKHASHNGTSVYTGVETFSMLPDPLSKGVSSLLPGPDHLAMVIEYTVMPDGTFRPGSLYRAVVVNKAKLIYEEVGDWLEGKSGVPYSVQSVPGLKEQIELQNTAAERLKQHRREQGALDLGTLEANAVVSQGKVLDLVVQEQNMARCLIEEFMVAANGTTVAFLNKADMPMIQRIVRTPKNWEGIRMTAAQYREKLPRAPDTRALAKFLIRRRKADPERFPDLSLTIVKLMGPGEYVPLIPGEPPVGHFALAVTDYTHGTAPNRRYIDLIIQRIIKSVLDDQKNPYSNAELKELSTWLTGREKGSKKVERLMQKAAAAVLLQNKIGQLFEGLVTGASEKGTYVRILSPPVEGRVVQGCRGLYVGQKVRVRLLRTDPYQGYIDFDCTGKVR